MFARWFRKKRPAATGDDSTDGDIPCYPCGTPIPPDKISQNAAGEEEADLGRRKFLFNLSAIPFIGAFTWAAVKSEAFKAPLKIDGISGATTRTFSFKEIGDLHGTLPKGRIGNVELSRMFMGCNLIGGWAHSRDLIYVSDLVKKYHTQEKVMQTLALGEQCGMNCIIMNTSIAPYVNTYWKEARDSKMQWISDCAGVGSAERGIEMSVDMGAAACYIQGEITEAMLRDGGDFAIIGEWMELIRRKGVPAGIGAHSLEVIQKCVAEGIRPDFWVKTYHHTDYWSAKPQERHDNIWCVNPEETRAFMETLEEPWIAFKVLAAGAIHPNEGFKYAFEGGADFICVGMYDFQVVEDVNIASGILKGTLDRTRPWRG
jgi:hypothetical protein